MSIKQTIITKEWLQEKEACDNAQIYYDKTLEVQNQDVLFIIDHLIETDEKEKLEWANWLIPRVLSRPGYLKYAIHAAEDVLSIYEKEYTGDDRPRQAIEAAKAVLAEDTQENWDKARAAWVAWAAWAAWAAAWAADAAAWAVAAAAWAVADAAKAAAAAAWAAAKAAARTAKAAWNAGIEQDYKETLLKYIKFGIKLINEERKNYAKENISTISKEMRKKRL